MHESDKQNFSTYVSAFNLIKNNFDYKKALKNFCTFSDEVVVACNTSEDNSLEELKKLSKKSDYKNLVVIDTDFDYSDNRFDGKIKNAALQATTKPLKISMDMDERFILQQRNLWDFYGKRLLETNFDCLAIPSIDLYGSLKTIRKNHNIGIKFRLHRSGLFRGVVNFAEKENGLIDINRSDTCELVDANHNLARVCYFIPQEDLIPSKCSNLMNFPYTIHLGWIDFDYRININKVWKPHWENRAGYEIDNIILDKQTLNEEPVIEHYLPLYDLENV